MIKKLKQSGFTVTELLIAMSVAVIVSGVLLTVTIVFYGEVLRQDARSRMTVDSQIILRNIVDEMRVSSEILTTNTILDANEPSGGWATDSGSAILIISTPALDNSGEFIIDDLTGAPYQNEIIYFSENNNMFRRVLANENATGNRATTTCPQALSSESCPADRFLTTDYEVMNFTFYDQDDAETTDPTLARSVFMEINLSDQIFGQDVSIENDIRVTLRN